jgi:hypothetical protein
MSRLSSFYKHFQLLFFLFVVSALSVTAQESNIYQELLKESLKMDFMKMAIPLETDSNFYKAQIFNDIDEENLYRIFFRHRIEFLLPQENFFQTENKTPQLFPYITMSYTSSNNEPLDNGKFNGNGTFSGKFATKGDILMSKASYTTMVSGPGLLLLLATQTGIISIKDLHVKKESKKDKMLRIITKDVYHIDE